MRFFYKTMRSSFDFAMTKVCCRSHTSVLFVMSLPFWNMDVVVKRKAFLGDAVWLHVAGKYLFESGQFSRFVWFYNLPFPKLNKNFVNCTTNAFDLQKSRLSYLYISYLYLYKAFNSDNSCIVCVIRSTNLYKRSLNSYYYNSHFL